MSRACFATCWAARLYMRLPNSTLDIANRSHRPRTRRSPARCAGRGRPLQKATSREMIHSWHGVLVPAWVGRSRLQSILSPRNTGPQGLVRVKLREASLREPAGRCAWECLLPRADHPERVGPPGSLGRQEPWRARRRGPAVKSVRWRACSIPRSRVRTRYAPRAATTPNATGSTERNPHPDRQPALGRHIPRGPSPTPHVRRARFPESSLSGDRSRVPKNPPRDPGLWPMGQGEPV